MSYESFSITLSRAALSNRIAMGHLWLFTFNQNYIHLSDYVPKCSLVVQNKESACNAEDPGLVPESRRSPGEGNGFSSILAWRIPWTEEPGKLQSMGLQRV